MVYFPPINANKVVAASCFLVGLGAGYLMFGGHGGEQQSSNNHAQEAIELAQKASKGGNVMAARLYYLNAINQDPTDIRAYTELEALSANATAEELNGLVHVLQSALCRVAPQHVAKIQALALKTQKRLNEKLDQGMVLDETPQPEGDAEAKPVVEAGDPVDLESLMASGQPVDYKKAIQQQKDYISNIGDASDSEGALSALQTLLLLERVDTVLARPELDMSHPDLSWSFDMLEPNDAQEKDPVKEQIVTQLIVSVSSDMEQLMNNNADKMKEGSALTKAILDRVNKVSELNEIWLEIHDARLLRAELIEMERQVAASRIFLKSYKIPENLKVAPPIGGCTLELTKLEDVGIRADQLLSRLKSPAAQKKCRDFITGDLKNIVVDIDNKRRLGYNEWVLNVLESSHDEFTNGGKTVEKAKFILTTRLCWVDSAMLHPHVAQLYQDLVARLMDKVDSKEQIKVKLEMARCKRTPINQL